MYIDTSYDDEFIISDGSGNVIFRANKEGVSGLNLGNKSSSSSPYVGKKMISLGDSLSSHDKWQKWLVEWLGVTFDNDENINGKDGHAPMAKGGTAVFPEATDSVYIRALDAHYYNPDIIFVYAGQNDLPYFGSYENGEELISEKCIGTIDDLPYIHDVVFTELSSYDDYTDVYENHRPTLYSYLSGMIIQLCNSNPNAEIYVLTPMQMWDNTGTLKRRKRLRDIWIEISEKYGLKVIDLWGCSGVNQYNGSSYYPSGTNVHQNDYGNKRIALTIYQNM